MSEATLSIDKPTARMIINKLKSGTTPLDAAFYLDVGRDRWYRGMHYYFEDAEEAGESKVRFIRGRYGDGKTHMMAMAQYFALERNFVVSYASAEDKDTRLDKFEQVYSRIVKNLQTAHIEGGIESILRDWRMRVGEHKEAESRKLDRATTMDINFRIAVRAYLVRSDTRLHEHIVQWLRGEPVKLSELNITRSLKAGDSKDMMRSLSVFLRLIGYSGLLVLLDELDRIENQSTRIRQNCYQVLRELMDNTDGQGGMQGTLFYCAAPSGMFNSERGFREYEALHSRLEPAVKAIEGQKGVDYRATIINLEDTPLLREDFYTIARKVRDIHAVALRWDAAQAIPDERLHAIVSRILDKQFNISTPRLVATTIATIADFHEQDQLYDIDTEIGRAHEKADQVRVQKHRQQYED